MLRRYPVPVAIVALCLTLAPAVAAETAPGPQKEIYDAKADPRADIRAAVERASAADKHVLVIFGANWCSWCQLLNEVFTENESVKKVLDQGYEVVHVNIGHFDTNIEVAEHYNVFLRDTGIPCLSLLGANGKWLANQKSDPLETKNPDGYDSEKLATFLASWPANAGH